MGAVATAELVGGIVRRVREDKGMSRAQLAAASSVGARTLYALETGESENIGLGKLLKILDVLDLSMSIDYDKPPVQQKAATSTSQIDSPIPPWESLPEIWRLDDGGSL